MVQLITVKFSDANELVLGGTVALFIDWSVGSTWDIDNHLKFELYNDNHSYFSSI